MPESRAPERLLLCELLEREFHRSRGMLRAFPPAQLDRRTRDCPRSAQEMAWAFVVRERLVHYLLDGRMAGTDADPPGSLPQVIAAYEEAHARTRALLTRLTTLRWNEPLRAPVAPGRWEQGTRGELLWQTWKELAHHAAHFAVHLRAAREADAAGRAVDPPGIPVPFPAAVPV